MDATAFYNLEVEQALIGLCLQRAELTRLVTDSPADLFYDRKNQLIQQAMTALARAKQPIDLLTVDDWLRRNRLSDQAGGAEYLADCTQRGYMFHSADNYLRILKRCAMCRGLAELGKAMMSRAGMDGDPEEVREWAARQLKELRPGGEVPLIPIADALKLTHTQLAEEQQKQDEPTNKILSGIATLDNRLGGLRGGEYVAIGARPSVGKSILALTFCVNAARQGKRVLLVSLEMNETQITERILADQGDVPMHVITSGNIDQQGWEGINLAMGPVSRLPLWYSLEANTVEKVRRAAYQLYESGGIDMIAIDYLQLMDATYSKKQSRQEQISEISRGIRQLAAELKIPILVLTQLNRASVNSRTMNGQKVRREPTMSEARESGAIEQDANIFILLHNPERDEMQSDNERQMWDNLTAKGYTTMRMIIDKNRQGKRGRIWVAFDGDHMRFVPIVRKDDT